MRRVCDDVPARDRVGRDGQGDAEGPGGFSDGGKDKRSAIKLSAIGYQLSAGASVCGRCAPTRALFACNLNSPQGLRVAAPAFRYDRCKPLRAPIRAALSV